MKRAKRNKLRTQFKSQATLLNNIGSFDKNIGHNQLLSANPY